MKKYQSRMKITIDSNCYSDETFRNIALKIDNFSGREISKLLISLQYAMLLNPNHMFTMNDFHEVVDEKITQHKEKLGMM
jgi:ATPase family AAA domain-containing protein 3A/B